MTFPDQNHINRVRDALHRRSGNGASVMIGSGFSRNAVPMCPGGSPLPTWLELASQLHSELYPHQEAPRTPEGAPRIAQEYEAAFGRGALHDRLQRLVRDRNYGPGSAHTRLLKLPWDDIYTTNWDTLLERASETVVEQSYGVVSKIGQIPMATRPRIVKLHGSFPAQFPLIVTEEDYRTYPTKFAPFVNTVQQAMMETVFCLIGFSGDDPNFLSWSGWVRDNLGASALKIYLAGWLHLSRHRRAMLEDRNVVPIDLAQHPQAGDWPESLRHNYATEWLLQTLELGRPYDITNWPMPPSKQPADIPDILQPIDEARSETPLPEPTTTAAEPSAESIREITSIWRHNRLMYPGWLTMPYSNRWSLDHNTDAWGRQILLSLPDLTPVERLNATRELVWRENILLVPMHSDLRAAIEETLSSIDCRNRAIGGEDASGEDWATIREAWRNTAVALVTDARYGFDRSAFDNWVNVLGRFQDEDPDLRHRLRHEQCLWAIYEMDFKSLDDLLADWKTENCDPAWMMRKSALLWEVGRDSEAAELLNGAIAAIRAMPGDEHSVAGPSRESWATLVALGWDNRQAFFKRLRELVPLQCDVFGERQAISEGMGRNRPEEEPPLFDINRRRGTSIHFSNYDPQAIAYRAVRQSEMAGLPPFSKDNGIPATVWAEVLKKAADELADWNLEFAIRLVLRASNGRTDNTLGRILARTRLATLPTKPAERLAQACLIVIEKALTNLVSATLHPRIETAIETLSRLVVRVSPDLAETVLDKALEYCQNTQLAQGTWAGEMQSLLKRAWEALPEENRRRRAIDLLNAPIIGLDSPSPLLEHDWPDPGELLSSTNTTLQRTLNNENQWQAAIDLVTRGLISDGTPRLRASIRMIALVESSQLIEEESQKIARALWSERHTPPDGLPANTELFDWAFLSFPEPTPGLAQERFRSKWLSFNGEIEGQHKNTIERFGNSSNGLNHDTQDLDSRLWQVGRAMLSLRNRGEQLTLPDAEKADLQKLVVIWADAAIPDLALNGNNFFQHVRDAHKQRFRAVGEVLPAVIGEIALPVSVGEKLHSKLQVLIEYRMPALALAAGIVQVAPERLDEIATELRVGLTSDDRDLAASAMTGVRLWLEAALNNESESPPPPDDMVREVGIAIASRRSSVISGALRTACWIFEKGHESHKSAVRRLAEDGLNYLATELSYDRAHEDPDDIPLLRLFCAQLAMAMAKNGLDQHPAVARWLEIAREDPLPEVRNAVESQ